MNCNVINVHVYSLFGGRDLLWSMGCIMVKKVKKLRIIEKLRYKKVKL